MFHDEQELNRAIERLGIDARPRSEHRDALRAKMIAAFELCQQQDLAQPSTEASHRVGGWVLGLLAVFLVLCRIVRFASDSEYSLTLTVLSIVLGIAVFTYLRANPFRVVPHLSSKGA